MNLLTPPDADGLLRHATRVTIGSVPDLFGAGIFADNALCQLK